MVRVLVSFRRTRLQNCEKDRWHLFWNLKNHHLLGRIRGNERDSEKVLVLSALRETYGDRRQNSQMVSNFAAVFERFNLAVGNLDRYSGGFETKAGFRSHVQLPNDAVPERWQGPTHIHHLAGL